MSGDFLAPLNTPVLIIGVALLWWRMGHMERKTREISDRVRLIGKAIILLSAGQTDDARRIIHGKEFH